MGISKILQSMATSKYGRRLYEWSCKPKSEYFLNNTLPQIETVVSTGCYVWSTAQQKNIEKDQRDLLQIQNIGSGALGICVSSYLNRKVGKYGERVIKDLDPTKLDPKALRKISTGIRIAIPLIVTSTIMRFLTPVLLAGFSGKVMDKVREVRNRKLDTKA